VNLFLTKLPSKAQILSFIFSLSSFNSEKGIIPLAIIAIVAIIAIAVPTTVILVQNEQDNRQLAQTSSQCGSDRCSVAEECTSDRGCRIKNDWSCAGLDNNACSSQICIEGYCKATTNPPGGECGEDADCTFQDTGHADFPSANNCRNDKCVSYKLPQHAECYTDLQCLSRQCRIDQTRDYKSGKSCQGTDPNPTSTPVPTNTPTPTPTQVVATPTFTPTPTPLASCAECLTKGQTCTAYTSSDDRPFCVNKRSLPNTALCKIPGGGANGEACFSGYCNPSTLLCETPASTPTATPIPQDDGSGVFDDPTPTPGIGGSGDSSQTKINPPGDGYCTDANRGNAKKVGNPSTNCYIDSNGILQGNIEWDGKSSGNSYCMQSNVGGSVSIYFYSCPSSGSSANVTPAGKSSCANIKINPAKTSTIDECNNTPGCFASVKSGGGAICQDISAGKGDRCGGQDSSPYYCPTGKICTTITSDYQSALSCVDPGSVIPGLPSTGGTNNNSCSSIKPDGTQVPNDAVCKSGKCNPDTLKCESPTGTTGPAAGPCAGALGGVREYIQPLCGSTNPEIGGYSQQGADRGDFYGKTYYDLYLCNAKNSDGTYKTDAYQDSGGNGVCSKQPWTTNPPANGTTPTPSDAPNCATQGLGCGGGVSCCTSRNLVCNASSSTCQYGTGGAPTPTPGASNRCSVSGQKLTGCVCSGGGCAVTHNCEKAGDSTQTYCVPFASGLEWCEKTQTALPKGQCAGAVPTPTPTSIFPCPSDGKHICATTPTCDGRTNYTRKGGAADQACRDTYGSSLSYCCQMTTSSGGPGGAPGGSTTTSAPTSTPTPRVSAPTPTTDPRPTGPRINFNSSEICNAVGYLKGTYCDSNGDYYDVYCDTVGGNVRKQIVGSCKI